MENDSITLDLSALPFSEWPTTEAPSVATNTVIRTHTQSGQQAIDILKLYQFIDRYFASEIKYKYEYLVLHWFYF